MRWRQRPARLSWSDGDDWCVAGSPSVASLLLLLWWNTGTKGLHIVVRAREGMRCRQQRPTSNLLMPDKSMRGRETPNGIRQCAVTMSRAKRLLSCNIVANELLTIIDQEPKGRKHSAAPTQWEFIDKSIWNPAIFITHFGRSYRFEFEFKSNKNYYLIIILKWLHFNS